MKKEFVVDIENKDDVGKTLEELIQFTGDIKSFLKATQDSEFSINFEHIYGKNDDAGNFIAYEYEGEDLPQNHDLYVAADKFLFYKKALEYGFHSKLEKFIKNIIKIAGKASTSVWENEEDPLGLSAAAFLALSDSKYIALYTEFIMTNDMDHEVNQIGYNELIISKYGWNKETLILMAKYVSSGGQHGDEVLEIHLEEDESFVEALKNSSQYNDFIKEMKKGFKVNFNGNFEIYDQFKTLIDESLA